MGELNPPSLDGLGGVRPDEQSISVRWVQNEEANLALHPADYRACRGEGENATGFLSPAATI